MRNTAGGSKTHPQPISLLDAKPGSVMDEYQPIAKPMHVADIAGGIQWLIPRSDIWITRKGIREKVVGVRVITDEPLFAGCIELEVQ
jgi:hypothetical protein